MAVKIKDTDKGYRRTVAEMRAFNGQTLSVGVHESKPHSGGPLTTAELFAIHEFGLGNVPERSMLRAWVDGNKRSINREISKAAQRILKTANQGKASKRELNRLGLAFVASIQGRIAASIPPPLAPATIKRKGSSVPLIDTGQLRQSITHKVS